MPPRKAKTAASSVATDPTATKAPTTRRSTRSSAAATAASTAKTPAPKPGPAKAAPKKTTTIKAATTATAPAPAVDSQPKPSSTSTAKGSKASTTAAPPAPKTSSSRTSRTTTSTAAPVTAPKKAASSRNAPIVIEDDDSEMPVSGTKRKSSAGHDSTKRSRVIVEPEKESRVMAKGRLSGGKAKGGRKARSGKEATEEWVKEIAGDKNILDAEVLAELFETMNVSLEGPGYLVLAFFLSNGAHKFPCFEIPKALFLVDMINRHITSTEALKTHLGGLMKNCNPTSTNPTFETFYKWAFQHVKPSETKVIPLDEASVYFATLLDPKRYDVNWTSDQEVEFVFGKGNWPHLGAFLKFLKVQTSVKCINKDQWESFLPFNTTVKTTLEGYDELGGAWPYIYDEYIEWLKKEYPELQSCSNGLENNEDDSWMDH